MRYATRICGLAAFIVAWMLSAPVQAQSPVTVVVETEILKSDPLPGIKTQQTVQVDFARKTISQDFKTGKTDLGITQLDSIRNDFKIEDVVFASGKATFMLKGQAASGVGFLPDIDYRFNVTLWPDGHSIIRGCHDGYPAYRVKVAGRQEYFFPHGEFELSKLLGTCDIRLPEVEADKPGLTVTSTQIVPDGAGTGAIFFEASSRHAAVRLFFDDPVERSTRAPVYAIAPTQGNDSIGSYAVLRRASEQLLAGQGSLGAVSSTIIQGSWSSLVQPITLPHTDFRFIVRADSEVVKAINERLKKRVMELDQELKAVNTATDQAAVFQVAAKLLNEAASDDALRIPVDSTGRRMALPDPTKYASGLAWAMAYAYQSEGHAAMAGCEPNSDNVLPFKKTGDTTVLRAYLDVLAQANETRVFSAFAAGFLIRSSGTKIFIADTALKALKAIGSAVWQSDFGSFMALGQIDPARVQLARCKGARMLRGPIDPADFVVERSVMYGVASTAIEAARIGQPKVRFFDAARAVTQLLGVGMVDLADDVDIDNKAPVVVLARDLLASNGCIPANVALLPEPRDRALLRRINAELLVFNQPRIKRLLASPQGWFDPVTMGRFKAPESMSAALYFDLRMVVAEQYHVEKLLRGEKLTQEKARDDALSAAERALRCIAGNALLQQLRDSGVGLQHLDLLASVDGLLKAATPSASLPPFEQRFSSLRWRIAIGSAYVFALHRPDDIGSEAWGRQYVAYLRTLFDSMQADGRRHSDVPAALSARIEGVFRGATARWGETSGLSQVKGAVQAFLARSPDTELYRCDRSGAAPILKTGSFPRSVSQRERIRRLRQHGVGIVALPFELAAEEGALQSHLAIDSANAEDFCAALDIRHSALECAVSPTASTGCSVNTAVSPGRDGKSRLLLMENAVGLRSDLGHLAPFLMPELRRLPGTFGQDDLQRAVGKSASRESIYRRNLALASILKSQTPATLRALKVNQEPAFWKDLVAQAEAPGAKNPTLLKKDGTADDAAIETFAADHELEAQIARIDATEATLAKAVKPLAQPATASDDAAVDSAADPDATETPRTALDRLSGLEPGETGLGFELVETGQSEAGDRLHDAVLVYRRWQVASSAAICPANTDPQATCAAPLSTDGAAEPAAISGERTPQRIPLGLRLTGLALDGDGRLQIISTLGDADIDVDPQQTKAALYELGLPRSINLDAVDFEVSRDMRTVTLKVNLSVAGTDGLPISLPLVRDGDLVDPSDALKEQAVATLQSLLISQADRLRLDIAIAAGGDLPIAVRLKAGSVKPNIDWAGGTLTAAAELELAIGGTPGFVAGASVELLIDRSGAAVRRISFAPVDPNALVDAVKNLGPFKALSAIPGLSIVPEVAGGRIALHVRAVKEFDGCEVAIEASIDLANPKLGLDALADGIARAARDTAICQASKQISDIANYLSNEELDLFGLKVTFDFDAVRARGGVASGRLPLPLEFVAGQFNACDQPPAQARLEGFAIEVDEQLASFKVDLGGLSGPERLALGAALRCRLMAAVGPVSGFLSIGNVEIGRGIAAADLTFSGLPFLGNITMRVDFADPAADPMRVLYGAIVDKAQITLATKLEQAASNGLNLPGVGAFKPEPGGFTLDLIDKDSLTLKDNRSLSVTGRLLIADSYDVRARIVFPLDPGNLGAFRIELPDGVETALLDQLVSTVSNLLPFPGNGVKVIAPRVAKLDDTGHRWGLVFGLTVEMELGGQGFRIAVQRVAISLDGVDLDREIRLGLKTPMYFGPVALSQIIVIYHTGSDGGAKGLALGADMTALEPQLANVLKIESILDLRDIDRARFDLQGRLIAFNSVALLEATGLVDLAGQEARFDAATTDAIKAIIKASAEGEIVGRGVNLFKAKSSMELLGVDMSSSLVSFCTKSCDPLFPDGGSAKLSVSQNFLFGTGNLDAATDLEFSEPGLKARVGLDLFGWKPGKAGFSASTNRTRLELSFLGLHVGITTPTVELMSPALIADVLKSLLDIDLKNLLKLPKDIEISLMKGDGSISSVNPGGKDGSSQAPAGSDNGGEGAAVPAGIQPGPGPGTVPSIPGANGLPPAEVKSTGPAQPFWGESVTGIYCEEVSGSDNNGRAIADGDRYELWGQVFNPPSAAQSPILQGVHPHPRPSPWHSSSLSAETARKICVAGNGGRTLELSPDLANVGVARAPIGWRKGGCENNIPDFRYFRFDRTDEKRRSQFTNAQRAVLCHQVGAQRFDIEARLLWKLNGGYLAILYCPFVPPELKSTLETMPGWAAACGDGQPGYVDLTAVGDEATVIGDRTELELIEDRLRGQLMNSGAPAKPHEVIDSGEFSFGNAVVRFEQRNVFRGDGQIEAVRFDLELPTEETGATRVEFLRLAKPDDPNSGLWPWLQPDRKGIRAELLRRWLSTGRRPDVIRSWPAEGWLALRQSQERNAERQVWLKDMGAAEPGVWTLDAPVAPPGSTTAFGASEVGPWMDGLKALVPYFKDQPSWTLTLGAARETGMAVYAFWAGENAVVTDAFADRMIVHLHPLAKLPPANEAVWTGGAKPPGRSLCGTAAGIVPKMREFAEPALVNRVALTSALTDADAMTKKAGLKVHVFGILAEVLGECQ
ncbi:hypothetical protein [Mesorhizobium sp. M0520]|uniref:hypothetical protein n=1 Tax=Mesorhizobium sp. M0520 TaxID=2956957 RepID=UPI003334C429